MQTDILIPLGAGSKYNNIELRYCLRSIEKHLKGVGNIFIVGDKPDFVKNVIHIPCRDNPNNWKRAENIYKKIMAGINWNGKSSYDVKGVEKTEIIMDCGAKIKYIECPLSDNFLFMNDDHFLLSDYEASKFPYYHRGNIELHRVPNEAQSVQYRNTSKIVGNNFLDFGNHCPILYNKELFIKAFEGFENNWPDHGYEIKSVYANQFAEHRVFYYEDLKFTGAAMKESIYRSLEHWDWFSIGDVCLRNGQMQQVLEELYPLKSKYEANL